MVTFISSCFKNGEEETTTNSASIVNPIKTYDSYNDINSIVGFNIAMPSSLSVDNLIYNIINDELSDLNLLI